MKLKEIEELMKQGKEITWTEWGGKNYRIDSKTINYNQIKILREKYGLKSLYNNRNPLTGVLRKVEGVLT